VSRLLPGNAERAGVAPRGVSSASSVKIPGRAVRTPLAPAALGVLQGLGEAPAVTRLLCMERQRVQRKVVGAVLEWSPAQRLWSSRVAFTQGQPPGVISITPEHAVWPEFASPGQFASPGKVATVLVKAAGVLSQRYQRDTVALLEVVAAVHVRATLQPRRRVVLDRMGS